MATNNDQDDYFVRELAAELDLCPFTLPRRHPNSGPSQPPRRPFLSCILCKTAGRPHNTQNLMDCRYLPDRDRRPWARSRMVMDDPDDLGAEECKPLDESSDLVAHQSRVKSQQPFM